MSTRKDIVEEGEQWGVRLPDGTYCETQDENDARAIVYTAKVMNPRAKYQVVKAAVYFGEWVNA